MDSAASSWESHWLIERPVEGETHPVYWSGKGWTPDPWQAKRFVTEAEANRAIHAYLHPFIPTAVEAKTVSHGFETSSFEAEKLDIASAPYFEVVHDDGTSVPKQDRGPCQGEP